MALMPEKVKNIVDELENLALYNEDDVKRREAARAAKLIRKLYDNIPT